MGRAPTARRMASSRRRSPSAARIDETSPASPTTPISADISSKVFSPTPTICHSASSATPGSTAIRASCGSSSISRCSANTRERQFQAHQHAGDLRQVSWNLPTSAGGIDMPGTGAPACRSRWMASLPSSRIWTVRFDRRARRREDAGDHEGLVGMIGMVGMVVGLSMRVAKNRLAMAQHDPVTYPVAQPARHVGTSTVSNTAPNGRPSASTSGRRSP